MTGWCEWRPAPEACAEDLGDLKKSQLVELNFSVRGRRLTFGARRGLTAGVARSGGGGGGRWKSHHRKIVSLYLPYDEKPFNSKIIKCFVLELRSRQVFLCFGISMLSICALWTLWTFCIPVWICLFHVFIYSYVTYLFIHIWFLNTLSR